MLLTVTAVVRAIAVIETQRETHSLFSQPHETDTRK